ncbi:hypothetical protein NC652_011990 [Populus alba x Populus x berolinensis]|nr:hypothetical protein NC652_011990 [Populus alba x Populus x berolinensis]
MLVRKKGPNPKLQIPGRKRLNKQIPQANLQNAIKIKDKKKYAQLSIEQQLPFLCVLVPAKPPPPQILKANVNYITNVGVGDIRVICCGTATHMLDSLDIEMETPKMQCSSPPRFHWRDPSVLILSQVLSGCSPVLQKTDSKVKETGDLDADRAIKLREEQKKQREKERD